MTGIIDRLVYLVGYKTDETSLARAQQGLASLATGARIAAKAAAAVSAALTGAAKAAASYGDNVGKTAAKLGIGVEALQEFRYAANLSGIQQRTFDMAMQRSTRRVAEAAAGYGEAQNALKELGLDAKRLNQLSPDEQLLAISDAMSQVENSNDRLRLSMKLFDSEGVVMVNLMGKTREEIMAMRQEARDLGAVMSEESVAAAEAMQDTFTRLTSTLKGLGLTLGVMVFEPLTKVIDKFNEWVQANREWLNQGITEAISALVTVATVAWEIFSKIAAVLNTIVGLFGGWESVLTVVFGLAMLASMSKFLGILTSIVTGLLGASTAAGGLSIAAAAVFGKFLLWAAVIGIVSQLVTWLQGGDTILNEWIGTIDEVRLKVSDFIEGAINEFKRFKTAVDDFFPQWMKDWVTGKTLGDIKNAAVEFVNPGQPKTRLSDDPQLRMQQTNNISIDGAQDPAAVVTEFERRVGAQNEFARGAMFSRTR